MWRGEHKGRGSEEEEGEEKETAAVDAAKIVALLETFFVVWRVFLFSSSFPNLLQVQKNERVDIQHWCGEAT